MNWFDVILYSFYRSPLGSNMYTYLKFGLPRVFPPNGSRHRDGSSGYDSSDDGMVPRNVQRRKSQSYYLRTRSDPDFRNTPYYGVSITVYSSDIKKIGNLRRFLLDVQHTLHVREHT